MVVRLSLLSGRALVAQARVVLGSTPGPAGLFTFLYFRLIPSKFLYNVYLGKQKRESPNEFEAFLHYVDWNTKRLQSETRLF